jgi:hypothetical protein
LETRESDKGRVYITLHTAHIKRGRCTLLYIPPRGKNKTAQRQRSCISIVSGVRKRKVNPNQQLSDGIPDTTDRRGIKRKLAIIQFSAHPDPD